MENVNKISVKLTENINQYSICIGRCGEYGVTLVEFDISQYIEKYGDITATLSFALPYSTQEFLVPTIVQDKKIMWLVGNDATKEEGTGTARIRFYRGGEKLKKTPKILCKILEGGSNDLDPQQEEYKDWITQAQELLTNLTNYAWTKEQAEAFIVEKVKELGGSDNIDKDTLTKAIADYITENKEELKGKDGNDYVITEDDYLAIINILDGMEIFAKKEDLLRLSKEVSSQSESIVEISQLLPDKNPTVGKMLKVLEVNEDGTFKCEWVDAPEGGGETKVKIGGTAITNDDDGYADVPVITDNTIVPTVGLVKFTLPNNHGFGFKAVNDKQNTGNLYVMPAPENGIWARVNHGANGYGVISTNNFDYAVKAALCDGKGKAYTPEEQAMAQARLGIREEVTHIEKIASGTVTPDTTSRLVDTGITWEEFSKYKRLVLVRRAPSGNPNHGNVMVGFHDEEDGMVRWSLNTSGDNWCELVFTKINNNLYEIDGTNGSSAYWSFRDEMQQNSGTPCYGGMSSGINRARIYLDLSVFKDLGNLKMRFSNIPAVNVDWWIWTLTK